MDAHPPTTADFAAADASDAQLGVKDCLVLIGWLSERVASLERFLQTDERYVRPELPSRMGGFGCYPRRDRAVADAMAKMQ